MLRFRLATLAVLFSCTSTAIADDFRPAVDEIVLPFLKDKDYLGMMVGIVTPNGASTFSYGNVTIGGEQRPPDGETIFALASLTKAYTGVLLADLVRAGKIKLDDPAQEYLPPEWVLPTRGDKAITILDLTTHHSGLPVQPLVLNFLGNPYASLTVERIGKDLGKTKLESDPGSAFDYSNYGAGLLGHALAKAAGASSFDEALTERIVGPLQMKDTRVRLSDVQKARRAAGFSKAGKPTDHWEFALLEACGGLNSTINDQMRFLSANLGLTPSPLLPALLDSHQPRRDTDKNPQKIGLGWIVMPLRADSKHSVVWHNGGTRATHSYLAFVPDAKVGVVMLAGADQRIDPLALALLRKLVPE